MQKSLTEVESEMDAMRDQLDNLQHKLEKSKRKKK